MTLGTIFEIATDPSFRELANFITPPRAGKITAVEGSGQVRVDTDDPDGGDVLAWPLDGFEYAVDDVVYVSFAVNRPDSAMVVGSRRSASSLSLAQLTTSGETLRVERNLTGTSTDSPVVSIVQDHSGDDQAALRVQQDGSGNILQLYDGATLTFSVADGGAVNAKGAVDFDSTLNVDGAATFQSTVTLSPGGTQDYSLSDDGANALTLNALGAGKDFDFRIHTQDADGTDNVLFSLYAIGKPGSYTNYERGRLIYAAAGPEFRFDTGAAGSGTVRPLVLLTQGNTNQIRLATSGFVGFKVASPGGIIHGHDGTGGFLHVSKTGIVGSAVEMIPDGTGDVTKGVKIVGMAANSTPNNFDVNLYVANGGTGDVTDGGGNTLRFAVAANGQLTVIRQAGALTWACSVWCVWQ